MKLRSIPHQLSVLIFSFLFIQVPVQSVDASISDFCVNPGTGAWGESQDMPVIAMHPSGMHVVAWQDDRAHERFCQIYFQIFSANNTPVGPNSPVYKGAPEFRMSDPAVAVFTDGKIIIVWEDYRRNKSLYGSEAHILFQILNSEGAPISETIRVDDDESILGQTIGNPDVAVNSKGEFVIVWEDWRLGGGIYAQRFSTDGMPAGSNFSVSDAFHAWTYYPSVAIDDSGRFAISWMDQNAYLQLFNADGTRINGNIQVNTDDTPSEYIMTSSQTIIHREKIAVVWEQARDEIKVDICGQFFTRNGEPIGDNFTVSDENSRADFHPTAVIDNTGNLKVVWSSNDKDSRGGISFRSISANSEEICFIKNFCQYEYTLTTPGIALDAENNMVVVWNDRRNQHDYDIFAQRFTSDCSLIGNNYKINDDVGSLVHSQPDISVDSQGNFAVSWLDHLGENSDELRTKIQQFRADASPIGLDFIVDSQTPQQYPAIGFDYFDNLFAVWLFKFNRSMHVLGARFQFDGDVRELVEEKTITNWKAKENANAPSFTSDTRGQTFVTWQREMGGKYSILAQRFTARLEWLGSQIVVNDTSLANERNLPAIASDSSGNFVIVWQELKNENWRIVGQQFDIYGNKKGANFDICETGIAGNQEKPMIILNETGVFTVTWQDDRNGHWDIYARRFSFKGQPLGAEFKVNDDIGNADQIEPVIAGDYNGRFIIAWTDWRTGEADIFAQCYLSDGAPARENFCIPNQNAGTQEHCRIKLHDSRIYTCWLDDRREVSGNNVWANIREWANVTGISETDVQSRPDNFNLRPNFPNPFNTATQISYELSETAEITICIFNMLGQTVRVFRTEKQFAGVHQIIWHGRDDTGNEVPSGIYICRILVNGLAWGTQKIVLLR